MDIKKRTRAELKSYFVKNAIPTEGNFADLMDAVLVQRSDGVVKLAGEPLSVEAYGDDNSRKQALALYRSFTDSAASWSFDLSPRADPADASTARAGLGVCDASGRSRLFIDESTGRVGVGTTAPASPFHVQATGAAGLFESTGGDVSVALQTSEGVEHGVALANRGGRLALSTRLGGDALNVLRDGKVGVATAAPQRVLHVGGGGQVSLSQAGGQATGVNADSQAGLFWHTDDAYAIRRSSGPWTAPDYQQLVIDWPAGIVLQPGSGNNVGPGKGYVDVRNGKGLRVTEGTLVVGGTDPGEARFKVASAAADHVNTTFRGAGMGELRILGFASGYSVEALAAGKHLHLNRHASETSNVYIGRDGAEVQVLADGRVGIGGSPAVKLHVYGKATVTGAVTASNTLTVAGALTAKGIVDIDGAVTASSTLSVAGAVTANSTLTVAGAVTASGALTVAGALTAQSSLTVSGALKAGATTITGLLRAEGGINFTAQVPSHLEEDGSFYRFNGQAYLTVDDNFYIRDLNGGIKFHFDTDRGVIRQDNWSGVSLENGWANYGGGYNDPGYYKDRQGVVHLRGLVKGGASGEKPIFTLPEGCRPPGRELRVIQSGDKLGRVDITADGRVLPYSVNSAWVSLDGISFRAK